MPMAAARRGAVAFTKQGANVSTLALKIGRLEDWPIKPVVLVLGLGPQHCICTAAAHQFIFIFAMIQN